MYGSIFRMRVKLGQEQRLIENFKEWERELRPKISGVLAGFLLKPDNKSGEFIGVVVFKDKASYMANAGDTEQEKWYRNMRELLQADPEWEDGEYISGSID